jgi:hypothetical protein
MAEPFALARAGGGDAACATLSRCAHHAGGAGTCRRADSWALPIAAALKKLLDYHAPDAAVINTGFWGTPDASEGADIGAAVRRAIARARSRGARPLRVVWKSTTPRDGRVWPVHPARFTAQLMDAGAELFDAYALTAELGAHAHDPLGAAAFYGGRGRDFHLHPAVHAEVNAALLDHLARGWALEATPRARGAPHMSNAS